MENSFTGSKWGAPGYGNSGGQVTWSFAELAGGFFDFDAVIDAVPFQDAIRSAFDLWESVADIDFVEIIDSLASDIRLGWDEIDGAGGTLGQATWQYQGLTTIYSEIGFDLGETWKANALSAANGHDFFAVAVHEIGHSIGLAHVDEGDSIMYAYLGDQTGLSSDDVAAIQHLYGARSSEPTVSLPDETIPLDDEETPPLDETPPLGETIPLEIVGSRSDDIKVAAATYQFFTDRVPEAAGFEYLIFSDDNDNDLNDPYYEQFNQENRYINFANNLGSFGEGKDAFAEEYGDLSFEDTVHLAFEDIVGSDAIRDSGGDPDASIDFFLAAESYYEAVAKERVASSGVSLDEATKVVMIGSMLNEAVKADVGVYAEAIDELVADLRDDGASNLLGQDLFAAA